MRWDSFLRQWWGKSRAAQVAQQTPEELPQLAAPIALYPDRAPETEEHTPETVTIQGPTILIEGLYVPSYDRWLVYGCSLCEQRP